VFQYTAQGAGGTKAASVSLTVRSINDPPVAVDDFVTTVAATLVLISPLANDSDADGDALTIQSVGTTGTTGTVTINSGSTTVNYTPGQSFIGTDTFTYIVRDGQGGTATATVTVTVNPIVTADLVVTSLTAPTVLLSANPAIASITWTVLNQGNATTTVSQWTDRVMVSTNAIAGDADDVIAASFIHNGTVAAGADYTETHSVTLPANLDGHYFLYVRADVLNQVPEFQGENNNLSALAPIDVAIPYADLIVQSVTAPATGLAAIGSPRPDRSTGPPADRQKLDRSRDSPATMSDGSDAILGNVTHSGALALNATYCQRIAQSPRRYKRQLIVRRCSAAFRFLKKVSKQQQAGRRRRLP
jgi:hypothetical protein